MSIQLQNFVSLTTTGTSGASTLTNGVLNVPNYATSGGTWVDYSATSTIVGWSSFTNKQIRYLISGKQMFVSFVLLGTSNSTSATFTLPNNNININNLNFYYATNNGVAVNGSFALISPNSNILTFYQSFSPSWTSSGTKGCYGQIYIELA